MVSCLRSWLPRLSDWVWVTGMLDSRIWGRSGGSGHLSGGLSQGDGMVPGSNSGRSVERRRSTTFTSARGADTMRIGG